MGFPEFPKGFLEHCPKVKEAKWDGDPEPEYAAECAFVKAGCGLMCENCKKHLTRPFLNHEVDREFLPQIEEYYRLCDQWEENKGDVQLELF